MKIFISYAREDAAFVEILRADLSGLGHDVWIDQLLLGGQEWWDEILSNIRQCDLFVLGLSPNSIDSDACLLELRYADATRRTFLPAMVLVTNPNHFPPEIAHAQYVDYTQNSKDSLLRLVASISRLPPPAPLPDPLPEPPSPPQPPLYEARQLIALATELDRQHQLALLDTLSRHSANPKLRVDILELTSQFRQRGDIMADVLRRLDELVRLLDLPGERTSASAPVVGQRTWLALLGMGLLLAFLAAVEIGLRAVGHAPDYYAGGADLAAALILGVTVLRRPPRHGGWLLVAAGLVVDGFFGVFWARLRQGGSTGELNDYLSQIIPLVAFLGGLVALRPPWQRLRRSLLHGLAAIAVAALGGLAIWAYWSGGATIADIISAVLSALILGAGAWLALERHRDRVTRTLLVLASAGLFLYEYLYAGAPVTANDAVIWRLFDAIPWALGTLLLAAAATYAAGRWPDGVQPVPGRASSGPARSAGSGPPGSSGPAPRPGFERVTP